MLVKIVYHKRFIKALQKQDSYIQAKFFSKVEIFRQNSYDVSLNNHQLRGELKDFRSFDITGDVRVHYEIIGDCAVFLEIGTHSELY